VLDAASAPMLPGAHAASAPATDAVAVGGGWGARQLRQVETSATTTPDMSQLYYNETTGYAHGRTYLIHPNGDSAWCLTVPVAALVYADAVSAAQLAQTPPPTPSQPFNLEVGEELMLLLLAA
jgi:hypothetical protein